VLDRAARQGEAHLGFVNENRADVRSKAERKGSPQGKKLGCRTFAGN